jgi:hypothetical protein
MAYCRGRGGCHVLLCECLVEQPGDYGEVATLIVRREEHRVLVLALLRRHCSGCGVGFLSAQLLK